jgi:LPXTG-motif cell wall-anchored protein
VTPQLVAYLLLGLTLCLAFAGLGVFYYARKRKDRVEQPKYKMLEDDDDR